MNQYLKQIFIIAIWYWFFYKHLLIIYYLIGYLYFPYFNKMFQKYYITFISFQNKYHLINYLFLITHKNNSQVKRIVSYVIWTMLFFDARTLFGRNLSNHCTTLLSILFRNNLTSIDISNNFSSTTLIFYNIIWLVKSIFANFQNNLILVWVIFILSTLNLNQNLVIVRVWFFLYDRFDFNTAHFNLSR